MSNFSIDISGLVKGLASFNTSTDLAVKMYAETVAKDFESHAKTNRPWTDRTSRARQGLTGYVRSIPEGYRVIIAHTVDYGIWLEMAHEKNYAILEPTVRLKGPEAIKGMSHLLEGIRKLV